MKKLTSLLLSLSFLFMAPLFAVEAQKQQDPDMISIAGLKHEHVLLALWGSADGGNDRMGQVLFLAANTKDRPTEEKAKEYLRNSSGGYFCMRKISPPSGDTYYCKPFNDNHGKGRAQQIIQALQDLSLAGPITLDKIFSIYIPIPTELGAEKDAEIAALRKAGDFEEARRIHHYALREKEDAQMQALVTGGNFDAAMRIYSARSRRENAEVGGILMRASAQDGTAEEIARAREFNRGMALRQAGVNPRQTPPVATTGDTAPPPSPVQAPSPIQSRTNAPDDLSFMSIMAKGLRSMFEESAPKRTEPEKK